MTSTVWWYVSVWEIACVIITTSLGELCLELPNVAVTLPYIYTARTSRNAALQQYTRVHCARHRALQGPLRVLPPHGLGDSGRRADQSARGAWRGLRGARYALPRPRHSRRASSVFRAGRARGGQGAGEESGDRERGSRAGSQQGAGE